jgi:uncharacterized protein
MANSFHIDINSTKNCNLRCTYCFEVKNNFIQNKNFEEPDLLINWIHEFMKTPEFTNNYDDLAINFWGGEPTLNQDLYEKIINEFDKNTKVRFFMYTNGFQFNDFYINSFKKLQEKKVNGHPKIVIQISYDGNPIHDFDRVTINNKGSAYNVAETINQLKLHNIYHVLKSTIAPENFKYMFEAYKDVLSLAPNYFPTIDLHKVYTDDDDFIKYGQDLYENLIQIAVYEKKYNKKGTFAWFARSNKALCSAGVNMIAIDINGNILPCHGALYTDYDEHLMGNIKDINNIPEIINKLKWFKTFSRNEPQECKECDNNFCLRCNITKFETSKKETYEEKWSDHNNQKYLCYFFDILNIVVKAKGKI